MKLRLIESISALRKKAAAWDDLWLRSESTLPTHRAELAAQWAEHFAGRHPFTALTVEDDGQLVAALPLYITRQYGLRFGKTTANSWADCGTLLTDPATDIAKAMAVLADGEKQLGCPLVMFDGVDVDARTWQSWLGHRTQRGGVAVKPKYRVGVVDITHDWKAYMAAWSGNHRRSLKKLRKTIEQAGHAELVTLGELRPDDVEHLLHQAFEVEDRSWKGREGTSVLRTPKAFDFFLRQAQQLCAWNQFELYFLNFQDEPIAFDFCYSCKGVLSSHKIGYDETFRQFGPFQLLRSMQLEQLFGDPSRCLLDTLGILSEANAKWSTRYYQSSRVIAPTGDPIGRLAFGGYLHIWPTARKCLGRSAAEPAELEPGAARILECQPTAQESEAVLAGA